MVNLVNNITLNNDDGGENFSLSLSRKEFANFVLSLVSSPHSTTRRFERGFDLTTRRLENFLQRIDHFLNVNYHVIPTDSTVKVLCEDGSEEIFKSDQFFALDKPNFSDPIALIISSSFLVPFQRDGVKSAEKQSVKISFFAGDVGLTKVEISSTEVTWPDGLFNLINSEVLSLSKETGGGAWSECSKFFPLARYFGSIDRSRGLQPSTEEGDDERKLTDRFRNLFPVLMTIILFGVLLVKFISDFAPSNFIYDPATEGFVKVSAESIDNDWRDIARSIELTELLISEGLISAPTTFLEDIWSGIRTVPSMYWSFASIVFIIIFLNTYIYSEHCRRAKGRIILTDTTPPPRRENKEILSQVFGAVILGIGCNALFAWIAALMSLP